MSSTCVLQGGALDFFASLPEQIRGDYQTTKNALAERYSQLQNPLQAQVELARACQQPGETVSDFADRLRQLGRLAHPQAVPDDPTLDASLRGLFICGLRDAGLKSVLCNKSPDSMDAAVKIAREFQSQQTALMAMQQFGTAVGAHEAMTPQVMVASSGGSGVNQAVALQSLERRMDDIQQALQQLYPALRVFGAREEGVAAAAAAYVRPGPEPVKGIFVIGDSMVRRADLRPASADYRVETWVPRGKTWHACVPVLEGRARVWEQQCLNDGVIPWQIVIWLGGNDVYPRTSPPRPLTSGALETIGDSLRAIGTRAMDGVVLLGPVPRPSRDASDCWEDTAAFQLDRALCTVARERDDQPRCDLGGVAPTDPTDVTARRHDVIGGVAAGSRPITL
ncbi:hypothetical protein FJT64_006082 [Amphibalanus amphitrite]|uniref:Retrotransposon gag domain-containing protein n=1 Tax=Amphibalanus amphitrite TaxID=1232801 RepID=A0A6A4VS74_AMPAM|nr:hypothetical protein FJT64_006082 [Amphibalanus amphitrite]